MWCSIPTTQRASWPVPPLRYSPDLSWEREGFFPNVVFSNGWVQQPDGRILVYYGAADSGVGVAELVLRFQLSPILSFSCR